MIGPAPFRFTPDAGRESVEGPAFSRPFKGLAVAVVGGCGWGFVQLWQQGALGTAKTTGTGWFLLGLGMMVWTLWSILRSRTRLDTSGLTQRWVWDKHMAYDELAYGKLIRVPGLDWLIAPRLYVRTLMGKFTVFYGATPELVAEFERLVRELRAFRQT